MASLWQGMTSSVIASINCSYMCVWLHGCLVHVYGCVVCVYGSLVCVDMPVPLIGWLVAKRPSPWVFSY